MRPTDPSLQQTYGAVKEQEGPVQGARGGFGVRRALAWGALVQALSSATNFTLSVLAGRALGPHGLGVVFIGFSAFQLVLALARSMLVQPVIAYGAARTSNERKRLARAGFTLVFIAGSASSAIFVAIGLASEGAVGRGFLLFAPWIVPGLLQELWKAILFQEGKGIVAAGSEAARFATIAAAIPLVLHIHTDTWIVAAWGVAAMSGFALGFARFRIRPERPKAAVTWWHAEARSLGRLLGGREIAYQAGTYVTVVLLAGVIGSGAVGGLRSAEALFSPFSLIAAALALPALPALSVALDRSRQQAHGLAIRISGLATAAGISYIIVMLVFGRWLLTHLFGYSFLSFYTLIWPFAISQFFYILASPFTVLLIAEKRGRELLMVAAVGSSVSGGLAVGLAATYGVKGAAWGMAVGSVAIAIPTILLASRGATRQQST